LAAPPHFSLAPFIGAALGMLGWYEAVTPLFLTAAALMGLGLWLHLTEHHEHAHVYDEHHQHAHGTDDPAGRAAHPGTGTRW